MKFESADLKVGLAVVVAVLVLLGSVLWLSPTLSDRTQSLYAEFDRIDGIVAQAPVQLNGFTIGRVDQIEPRVNEAGALMFRVRLKLNWELADGRRLPLPVGTRARLLPPPIAVGSSLLTGFVVLESPPGGGPLLEPGATIPGVRNAAALDQMQSVALGLGTDVTQTLAGIRVLVDSLSQTVGAVNRVTLMAARDVPAVLAQVTRELATADSLMQEARLAARDARALAPGVRASMDSANLLLGDSRRLVAGLDRMIGERQPEIGRVMANLDTTTALLNNFVAKVSRRPYRVFTGVRPPTSLVPPPAAARRTPSPRDSGARAAAAPDSAPAAAVP